MPSEEALELDVVVPVPKRQVAARRHRVDVARYLSSDFPKSKWLFKPTETDLLKPAASVVANLESVTRVARRPRRPRRRRLVSRAPAAAGDEVSYGSTFVDSVAERAGLAAVEAAGNAIADTEKRAPEMVAPMPEDEPDVEPIRASTFAWQQKLKAKGMRPSQARSPRLARESPVVRRRLGELQLLDAHPVRGSKALEDRIAAKRELLQVQFATVSRDETARGTTTEDDEMVEIEVLPAVPTVSTYAHWPPGAVATPTKQQAPDRAAAWQAHRELVARRKLDVDRCKQARLEKIVASSSLTREERYARSTLAAAWLTALHLAASMHMFAHFEARPVRRRESLIIISNEKAAAGADLTPEEERAAMILGTFCLNWRRLKLRHAFERGTCRVRRFVKWWIFHRRLAKWRSRRREALKIIRFCLLLLNHSGARMRSAISVYRRAIETCQIFIRDLVAARRQRFEALKRVWLYMERALFHPTSPQLFAKMGASCPKHVGPLLVSTVANIRVRKQPFRLYGKDAFWRVTGDARMRALRGIFRTAVEAHRQDLEAFARDQENAGKVKHFALADARRFMTDNITTEDFVALADHKLRPIFCLFTKSPPLIFDALQDLYKKRHERRQKFDPSYDRELLRQVDTLLAASSAPQASRSTSSLSSGANIPATPSRAQMKAPLS